MIYLGRNRIGGSKSFLGLQFRYKGRGGASIQIVQSLPRPIFLTEGKVVYLTVWRFGHGE